MTQSELSPELRAELEAVFGEHHVSPLPAMDVATKGWTMLPPKPDGHRVALFIQNPQVLHLVGDMSAALEALRDAVKAKGIKGLQLVPMREVGCRVVATLIVPISPPQFAASAVPDPVALQ